jgi:hypothetical protein
LRTGSVTKQTLRKIQGRRWLPTVVTQTVQRIAHRFVVAAQIDAGEVSTPSTTAPAAIRLLQRFPVLQGLPATFVGIGALPEHAPGFARR